MLDSLKELFGAGSQVEVIYWLLASISTGILSLQIILNILGLDLDHDFDVDIGVGDVSLSGILALFAIGGWTGVLGYRLTDLPPIGVLGVALVAGIMGLIATAMMMKSMKNLEETGNLDITNAIGQTAEVYLGIPPARSGRGQVKITLQGKMIILDAITDNDKLISTGTKVIIYAHEKGLLSVEPIID